MEEYELTPQQINAVYLRCNFMPFDQLLQFCVNPKSGITIEGLRNVNYKQIDRLEAAVNEAGIDIIWTHCKDSIETLMDYILKTEQGVYSNKYLDEAKSKLIQLSRSAIQDEWDRLSNSTDVNTINDFVNKWEYTENFINRRGGNFDSNELDDARNKIEVIANGTIVEDFNKLKAIEDDYKRVGEINVFIQKYQKNSSQTAKTYISDASELMNWTQANIASREAWYKAKESDTIRDYVSFISQYPSCRYREEADERIKQMKGDLLTDIKRFPFNYKREDMFEYISSKTLTYDDLVTKSYILTDKGYNHIMRYPHLWDEQRALPVSSLENPHSQEGNTDIYFFGVPGSGKTCVLAGLMSLSGQLGFDFDPRGEGGGGPYATELCNYARSSMLPPKTDQTFIQVIDCTIDDEEHNSHNISIIEMGGEKTRDFAFMQNATSLEDLGPGAAGLLQNDNNKVIFFVIDPTNEKYVVMDDGSEQLIKQDNVLNCVASLLAKNDKLMRKVTAIHIILTKSDTLGEYADAHVIEDRLTQQGYKAVMSRIKKICETYDINKATGFQVGLFPFCVGKFMPGDVYTFDETDSLKILRVIQSNTTAVRQKTWGERFKEWFNS